MDEKVARKVGEIKAFTEMGFDFFVRAKETLLKKLNINYLETLLENFKVQKDEIEKLTLYSSFKEVIDTKAEKTKDKIYKMQNLYIGDEWDNPTEVLEWLGFFEGAAIVHFNLVQGYGEKYKDSNLKHLSEKGVSLHSNLLKEVSEIVKNS